MSEFPALNSTWHRVGISHMFVVWIKDKWEDAKWLMMLQRSKLHKQHRGEKWRWTCVIRWSLRITMKCIIQTTYHLLKVDWRHWHLDPEKFLEMQILSVHPVSTESESMGSEAFTLTTSLRGSNVLSSWKSTGVNYIVFVSELFS